VACIGIARAAATSGPAETAAIDVDRLRKAIAPYESHLDVLADGSILLTVPSGGAPTDVAARGARCALSLRQLLPARIVIGMGRANVGGAVPMADLIERGARMIEQEQQAGRIGVDDVTAGLLDGSFALNAEGDRWYLGGERDPATSLRTLLGMETACVGRE